MLELALSTRHLMSHWTSLTCVNIKRIPLVRVRMKIIFSTQNFFLLGDLDTLSFCVNYSVKIKNPVKLFHERTTFFEETLSLTLVWQDFPECPVHHQLKTL